MAVQLFDNRAIGVLGAAGPGVLAVTFSRVPQAMAFVMECSYRYGRQIGRIANMLTPHVVTVAGFPQGELSLAALVTLRDNLEDIIRQYSGLCGGGTITLSSYDPCTEKIASLSFMNCVLQGIGGKISMNEPVVQCALSFIFTHMWFNNV